MVDPKDRQNRGSLSDIPGVPEPATITGPMPAPIEATVGLSPDQLRPTISPDLAAINVQHGADSFRLSNSAREVVQPNNPSLGTLPGGLAYTPEEFDRMAGGNWKIGGTGKGIVGSRQTDREEELKKVA